MQATTRALAILAISTLLLAPVANSVLDEAMAAADRIPFRDADWMIEPPEQDPPEDPPEPEEGDQTMETEAPSQAPSQCSLEREVVALWNHEPPEDDPATAAEQRVFGPSQIPFDVTNKTRALGIAFDATNLTGQIEALVYQSGHSDDPVFSIDRSRTVPDDINVTGTVTPPELEPDTWFAELSYESHYDELVFFVVEFSCAEEGEA